jgi:dipeptidyl aminopeptidase/acylaminoacyl peptidase
MSPPILPAKTTGGSPSSTPRPSAAPVAILAPATVAGPLHGLQIAVPRWSPDGKSIAFIGGLMSDQGSTGGDLWIISSAGGTPHNLTPSRPTSPAWIDWDGNEHIYVSELAAGNNQLVRMTITGDKSADGVSSTFAEPVFNIPASVGDGLFSRSLSATADHSLFVFSASSFDRAPEFFGSRTGLSTAKSLDGLLQLSHFNDGVRPNWGRSESLSWKSESFNVQGWLTLPKDYDPAKKYPLIVIVHGGPSAAEGSQWGGWGSLSATPFSALGYFVLQPNPRGSFGQGEAFTQANVKDFGYGDLRDILAGVDAVEARYPIDPQRVGLTGWSYGGFMAMFAVTQTHRFRAAVAGAGISDWLSYYGENSIDQWMIPFFGASVYDDPAVYAKSSAITYIKQTTTPTLVVVGDRDGECPAPQSYEFWHALRDLHVPRSSSFIPTKATASSTQSIAGMSSSVRSSGSLATCRRPSSRPFLRRGVDPTSPDLPCFQLPASLLSNEPPGPSIPQALSGRRSARNGRHGSTRQAGRSSIAATPS